MVNNIYKQAIRAAFDNFIMVNETLAKHFKDANPALLMGYFISEDQFHEKNGKLDDYGYFYCKANKLEDKFGYSPKMQTTIINKLLESKLIQIVNKRINGSESISRSRHIKVLHENVYNLIVKDSKEEEEVSILPRAVADIESELITCTKRRGGEYMRTKEDEEILKIALVHGLHPPIIRQSFNEKHKRIHGKQVTAKYLLTAYIGNINSFQEKVKNSEHEREKALAALPSLKVG
ncbi:MAG TPA: hypothetical protein VGD31_03740 [Sphingobacteriaceae bacterium]